MRSYFTYPFDAHALLRKKKSIRRNLLDNRGLLTKRIAILGGSTTAELKDMIELFLLHDGISPVFYESEYNRYYEDLMFPNESLKAFNPEIIFIHTTCVNIARFPSINDSEDDVEAMIAAEVQRYRSLWDKIREEYACPIIQNNFELPHFRGMGNLDAYDHRGRSRFISELNSRFSEQARTRSDLYLNDINYLAAWFGLERWHDKLFWYSYKYAMSYEAIPLVANSIASIVKAIYGKTRKCLVLDLDNTVWGGVIGDDGLKGIQIGKETPESEAYTEFQHYVKCLKERGIILSVCSKNDEKNAREGFSHPDSVLAIDDFSVFKANWNPKHDNIRDIATELNIGIDSLVFADDNPVEREIVRTQLPMVSVPELGNNVAKYIDILDKANYFEIVSLSQDDLQRAAYYADNATRQDVQALFDSYDDFLVSLNMTAEIKPFQPVYLDRITQLTNKTNQFNVTTRRYSHSEIEAISSDSNYITLYGRLQDKFGDNGLVSIIIGSINGSDLHVDLWLMSCRVLKRGMEAAMFGCLAAEALHHGISKIYGYYHPTEKNQMVSGLFSEMGFTKMTEDENGSSTWYIDLPGGYDPPKHFIEVNS